MVVPPKILEQMVIPAVTVRGRVSGEERAHLSLVETAGQLTTWLRDRCTHAKPHRKAGEQVGGVSVLRIDSVLEAV
ncbi:hypothetical protein JOQ06_001569, partial [Pogonophryne albipinna]